MVMNVYSFWACESREQAILLLLERPCGRELTKKPEHAPFAYSGHCFAFISIEKPFTVD
jgi:hypothetical protein